MEKEFDLAKCPHRDWTSIVVKESSKVILADFRPSTNINMSWPLWKERRSPRYLPIGNAEGLQKLHTRHSTPIASVRGLLILSVLILASFIAGTQLHRVTDSESLTRKSLSLSKCTEAKISCLQSSVDLRFSVTIVLLPIDHRIIPMRHGERSFPAKEATSAILALPPPGLLSQFSTSCTVW